MGMGPSPTLSLSLAIPLLLTLTFSLLLLPLSVAPTTTIYDHLRRHGLPIGLLPKGITDYSINTTTGQFHVSLDQPCNAKFENQVHYDFNVSGTLTYAQIDQLSGISAQELFLWFQVKGIRVDVPSSGLIHFDVGVVDKQFSLSLFENPPDCTAADPVETTDADSQSQSLPLPPSQVLLVDILVKIPSFFN